MAVNHSRQAAQHHRAEVGGTFCHIQPAGAQGIHLRLRGVIRTADDGTGVTHTTSRRSSTPRDERHHRLVLHVGLNPSAGVHLVGAADFANHNDAVRVLIGGEHFQNVDEVQTLDGVATDAHTGGLANATFAGLPDRLIGQRSGTTDDANRLAGSSVEPVRVDIASPGPTPFGRSVSVRESQAPSCRGHHPLSRRRRVQPDAERLRDAQDGFESGMR